MKDRLIRSAIEHRMKLSRGIPVLSVVELERYTKVIQHGSVMIAKKRDRYKRPVQLMPDRWATCDKSNIADIIANYITAESYPKQ